MLKILNSVDNKKHQLENKKISIYNCGPTVYNYVHIGNIRPLITFDVLYRYLSFTNKDVLFLHNITDIDDKIINAAKVNKTTEQAITEKYTKAYFDLFDILNVKKMQTPKVSDHIKDIILYIQKLIDCGAAYVADGDVYFDIKKSKNYGHISHKNIDNLLDGSRKENKDNKKYALDFALWKKTEDGLNWKSPWSYGRPGWHTECGVMINKYAGDHVTIHGGGIDLKFPHHENENAQNLALFNRDIADFWMHVGHVNINNEKMAKSLNNFILVKDIITEKNANGLRWFFYKTKYQNPINYTFENFNDAVNEISKLFQTFNSAITFSYANNCKFIKSKELSSDFVTAMEDDLNFPNVITQIIKEIKDLSQFIKDKAWDKVVKNILCIKNELEILGIVNRVNHEENIELIKKWKLAIDSKDFKNADSYRKQLVEKKLM